MSTGHPSQAVNKGFSISSSFLLDDIAILNFDSLAPNGVPLSKQFDILDNKSPVKQEWAWSWTIKAHHLEHFGEKNSC